MILSLDNDRFWVFFHCQQAQVTKLWRDSEVMPTHKTHVRWLVFQEASEGYFGFNQSFISQLEYKLLVAICYLRGASEVF